MINQKAQIEINPVAIIGAILGGILAAFISAKMMPGVFMKILTFGVTAVVCYFVTDRIFR